MFVYILWHYDDGILGVYKTEEAAVKQREHNHKENYYHREDCVITTAPIVDE